MGQLMELNFYHSTGTLANSEDAYEMSHNATFHQGLHRLL